MYKYVICDKSFKMLNQKQLITTMGFMMSVGWMEAILCKYLRMTIMGKEFTYLPNHKLEAKWRGRKWKKWNNQSYVATFHMLHWLTCNSLMQKY